MAVFLGIQYMDRHTKTRDLFSGIMPVSGRGILWRIKDKSVYPDGLLSMGVGGVVAVISVLSRGKMGMGDGLLILAMGSVLSVGELLGILVWHFFYAEFMRDFSYVCLKRNEMRKYLLRLFCMAGYLGGMFL